MQRPLVDRKNEYSITVLNPFRSIGLACFVSIFYAVPIKKKARISVLFINKTAGAPPRIFIFLAKDCRFQAEKQTSFGAQAHPRHTVAQAPFRPLPAYPHHRDGSRRRPRRSRVPHQPSPQTGSFHQILWRSHSSHVSILASGSCALRMNPFSFSRRILLTCR